MEDLRLEIDKLPDDKAVLLQMFDLKDIGCHTEEASATVSPQASEIIELPQPTEALLELFRDPETFEVINVHPALAQHFFQHQVYGVKFMWDFVSSLNPAKSGGCILAHYMGLGKTFQTIALVHTLLTHSVRTNVNKVLVLCPLAVVDQWHTEFLKWFERCDCPINVTAM